MPTTPHTLPILLAHRTLAGARKHGAMSDEAISSLVNAAGIPPVLLAESGARITARQYAALYALLIEQLDDECIGFLSRPLQRGSFALISRSMLSAPSLELALRRGAHTFRLLQHDLAMHCVRDGELSGFALEARHTGTGSEAFLLEMLARVFWQMLAWLNRGRLPIRRIDFSFAQPAYAASYSAIFPAPLQFNQPVTAVWFDAAALQAPVRRTEEELRAALRHAPGNVILPRPGEHACSDRVKIILRQSEPDWLDLDAVAKCIHVSTSTLQRRLALEGTSFQSLKDELRRDLAIERLATSKVPVAQLAVELGFADATAFNRAFKLWTGSTPGSYRRR
ncbi:AraC family transcriptional regulator [Paraburkholderia pallida]|uniref:AraC family transcriptional regulator n=1 Tax=Paraburkholderia pallida TaxID=2547399 RepID=A0A4P7D9I2_9BURK|nr:AraC family transcriptional regulator [Paraburkholderia pallida]QBR03362.1 AraC family transcriptional regulator [Paraburkholderia pallida]